MNRQHAIKLQLNKLESTHQIRILFACESGSRAWGFSSPDSDYDVRFIYIHSKDWYLSIYEERDVIESPVNQDLDIGGWELRKALRLLAKRNCVLFEWLQSPIVYSINSDFLDTFTKASRHCFSPLAAMHHYLSSAKKYYEDCLFPQVKLKRYLYCLRCALAGAWIAQYQTLPPMEIRLLLPLITDKKLIAHILELIDLKAIKEESYQHPQEPDLIEYLRKTIAQCQEIVPLLPTSKPNIDLLNDLFREALKKHGY